jgi:hypothetical protein
LLGAYADQNIMRTCFKKRLVFWGFCGAQVRIISEGFQELSQAIFWFEACGSGFRRLEFAQAAFLHLQVQFDVVVGGGGRSVTQ